MRLMREIRCFPARADDSRGLQSWAGTPARDGNEPFWLLRAVVEGQLDEPSGYLCDIKELDVLLRRVAAQLASIPEAGLARALASVTPGTAEGCPRKVRLVRLEVAASPFLRFATFPGGSEMVRVTQSFEFSASHRLAISGFSDDENRRIFGKCSNPHGHGHNYLFEVTVEGTPDEQTGSVIELPHLNELVRTHVLDDFDHRNLNVECPEFAELNPSVENIARVIWRRLVGRLAPARLSCVKVWETPKTCAEYTGE